MNGPAARAGRILIVDDEPGNVLVLEHLLELAGYEDVHSTTDPTRVAAIYTDLDPDLVLLDLRMPIMDGFAVMQHLAELVDGDDHLPILVLTADATPTSKHAALQAGANDFVTKPFDHAEVLTRVANLLHTRSLHRQLRHHNERLEQQVRERTAELADAVEQLQIAEQDLRLAQEETIHRLALAAEFRDEETSQHIERMSRYCAILAARAGQDPHQTELLRIAVKMHDIGKIGIPDAILRKPGQLTPDEYEVMKGHAEIGHQILQGSRSQLARTGAMLAWTHHEKVDGSGYPRGLHGDQIPPESRIAAIADAFDALTTDRIYRNALPLPQALQIMRDGRGSHFDPDLLDLFLDSLDPILAAKQLLADAPIMSRNAPSAQA